MCISLKVSKVVNQLQFSLVFQLHKLRNILVLQWIKNRLLNKNYTDIVQGFTHYCLGFVDLSGSKLVSCRKTGPNGQVFLFIVKRTGQFSEAHLGLAGLLVGWPRVYGRDQFPMVS